MLVGTAVLLALAAVALYTGPRIASKGNAPRSHDRPTPRAEPAHPIPQLASHTCGYLSLAAVYRAYGLSEHDKNLRYRLGTDRVAHPFDASSTGTLHPDLFRVLDQDGFAYTCIDPAADDVTDQLRRHLASGHIALLLTTTAETGGLHWVITDVAEGDGIRIVDSLADEPRIEPIAGLSRMLSIITVRPAQDASGPDGSTPSPHLDGLNEMRRVADRLRDR